MFGIEFIELASFGKQVGIVLAGSAALWGLVFLFFSRRSEERGCFAYEWVASRLLIPLAGGVAVGAAFWFLLAGILPASAHEGIVLVPEISAMQAAAYSLFPVLAAWVSFSGAGLLWAKMHWASFLRFLPWFYGIQFVLAALLASFPVWTGEFSKEQWFFIGHNFHSILTFGTVLILDFLFLISKPSALLKQHVYPKFPLISKVIWVGLGIDFLSVALVFEEALAFTPKFFFMQTVIGVLIINGVLLAGPIARRMVASVRERGKALRRNWQIMGEVAGTVSVSSWFAVTFVDFFHTLSFEYHELVLLWGGLIGSLLLGHLAWGMVQPRFRI